MSDRVFAIHLQTPDGARIQSIAEKFKHHYKLGDSLVLVRSGSLAGEVAKQAGVAGERESAVGAVFKLNRAFAGYYDSGLWDWLDAD